MISSLRHPPRARLLTLLASGLLLGFVSCTACNIGMRGGGARLTLMSYNADNLFDDVGDGTEYREFDPQNGEWTTELFHLRLQNLAEVIRAVSPVGPDVVALEEIENRNVLTTLNDTYLKGMGYAVISPESRRTSVTVGLLTRLPILGARMHHTESESSELLRDILEVRVDCAGVPLVLFVNHWKSKLGGAQGTEPDRRLSAAIVARRIVELRQGEPALDIVVAGDLNECWDEYERIGGAYPTALMPDSHAADAPAGGGSLDGSTLIAATPPSATLFVTADRERVRANDRAAVLFSPWQETAAPGSYAFGGGWETIDNMLLAGSLFDGAGLEYESFETFRPDFMLTKEGSPLAWSTSSARGFSDHLPILLRLTRLR